MSAPPSVNSASGNLSVQIQDASARVWVGRFKRRVLDSNCRIYASGTYQPGTVLLVTFPFGDASGAKKRSALVVADTGDRDILLARITSHRIRSVNDVELLDRQQAGLLFPSIARVDKLATPDKRLIERALGQLTGGD